jgi:hypothetical protein
MLAEKSFAVLRFSVSILELIDAATDVSEYVVANREPTIDTDPVE